MSTIAMVLLVVALASYGLSTALFIGHLLSKKAALATTGDRTLVAGLICHAAGKAARFMEVGALPVTDSLEALNLLALVLSPCHLVSKW